MSATTEHDIRAAMRPLVNPVTGTYSAGSACTLAYAALASGDRRLRLRNLSTTATIGVALLPLVAGVSDGSALTLADTYQIPPGKTEFIAYQAGIDLWLVADADNVSVSVLSDDVSGA